MLANKLYKGRSFYFDRMGLTFQEFCVEKESDVPENGSRGTIQGVDCYIDEKFENNYYNVRMADGSELCGISGYHLKLI